MKKSMKGEGVLSAYQMQATRLNKLEYHRLQRNINIMHNDLQEHLAGLQRQAQVLKNHYSNVVRVVQPKPAYKSWRNAHEIQQVSKGPKSKAYKQVSSSNEINSRPLLVLLDNGAEKPPEPIINFDENIFRPKTSPVNKRLPTQHRTNPLLTMLQKQPVNSNNQEQSSDCSSGSFLPSTVSTNTQRSVPTQKMTQIDILYRIALQNQTAYTSVDKTRIEKRKLFDKEFAAQHRALKGTMRSAGLVK